MPLLPTRPTLATLIRAAGVAVAAIACLVIAPAARAALVAGCDPGSSRPAIFTAALATTSITVGRDTPNGTVLYRQVVNGPVSTFDCNLAFAPTVYNPNWLDSPLAKSSWNQGRYAGATWETGVPGIGVAVESSDASRVFPHRYEIACGAICRQTTPAAKFALVLIKTGTVGAGTINGGTLPRFRSGWWKDPFSWVPDEQSLIVTDVRFAGAIHIVARTCRTPDVNVKMGAHARAQFSGKGRASAWVPFQIRLEACPAFHAAQVLATSNGGVILPPFHGHPYKRLTIAIGGGR